MDCIISTFSTDDTARIFDALFKSRGLECYRLMTSDIPSFSFSNIDIGEDFCISIKDDFSTLNLVEAIPSTFWLRRLAPPKYRHMTLHPDDHGFVGAMNRAYLSSLMGFLTEFYGQHRVTWVNPLSASRRAESKISQLYAAKKLGFKVPETLFSNDYQSVKQRIVDGAWVRKDFLPYTWSVSESTKPIGNYTSNICIGDLPDGDASRSYIGIFQRRVAKQYELRITVIGDYVHAIAIHSQARPELADDWRAGDVHPSDVEEVELDETLAERCRAIVRYYDLKYACMDVVFTASGEHVFLDLNQMGQFLWVDELDENSFLMEAFFQLLVSGNVGADWRPPARPVHMREIIEGTVFRELYEQDLQRPILSFPEDFFR